MFRTFTVLGAFALAAPAIAQDAPSANQAAPAQASATVDIAAAVAADWPKHDNGGKGHLTKDEFGSWLISLRAKSATSADDPSKVKAWADNSFIKADANGNAQVTPEELTAFLETKVRK